MTDSMIPYSFIPGTKAKATEVNANFVALAGAISENISSAAETFSSINASLTSINSTLNNKADKSDFLVEEANTDLNNYKTKGTYVFGSGYAPHNEPEAGSGTLIVAGINNTCVKQIWITDQANHQIYVRTFSNSAWNNWKPITGEVVYTTPGSLKHPSGLLIQWGLTTATSVTYPIAYANRVVAIAQKQGSNLSDTTTDTGFSSNALTGFQFSTGGTCSMIFWLAIGI